MNAGGVGLSEGEGAYVMRGGDRGAFIDVTSLDLEGFLRCLGPSESAAGGFRETSSTEPSDFNIGNALMFGMFGGILGGLVGFALVALHIGGEVALIACPVLGVLLGIGGSLRFTGGSAAASAVAFSRYRSGARRWSLDGFATRVDAHFLAGREDHPVLGAIEHAFVVAADVEYDPRADVARGDRLEDVDLTRGKAGLHTAGRTVRRRHLVAEVTIGRAFPPQLTAKCVVCVRPPHRPDDAAVRSHVVRDRRHEEVGELVDRFVKELGLQLPIVRRWRLDRAALRWLGSCRRDGLSGRGLVGTAAAGAEDEGEDRGSDHPTTVLPRATSRTWSATTSTRWPPPTAASWDDCPVLDAEGSTRASRLALSALAEHQLTRGLGLLGIGALDKM